MKNIQFYLVVLLLLVIVFGKIINPETEKTESKIEVSNNDTILNYDYIGNAKYTSAQDENIHTDTNSKEEKIITTECILETYIEVETDIKEEISIDSESNIEIEIVENTTLNTSGYSDDDFNAMCRIVEAETHGGDAESKMHIVSVILNRVNSSEFPNTIQGVCYQSGQFASRSDVEQSTIDAVNAALISGDTVQGALFFCTCSGCWADTNKEYLFTDNIGHRFYR